MTYRLTTLPNQLRIASECLTGMESVALTVSIGVGSRYELENQNGLSHILEHMAFKGTHTRSARQIAEAFEDIGGQFNAYTSVEYTSYFARVLKQHMGDALELLADIIQNSIIDEEELKREEAVIVQEIGMHMDTPEDYITDLFDATAYPGQAIGRSILGTEEKVMSYTRDDVARYMNTHYQAPRMVIAAAGNLTHENFLQEVGRHFHLPHGNINLEPEPAQYHGGACHVERTLEQTHVQLGFKGVPITHADYPALQLLSMILGGGMSSRLFQEIREKRGLAYSVSSHVTGYADTGLLSMYAATSPAQMKTLPEVMTEELAKLAEDVSAPELARAKIQQQSDLVLARENSSAVASWIGRHLLIHGEYLTLQTLMARIERVTKEDIKRLAVKLIESEPTLAVLGA